MNAGTLKYLIIAIFMGFAIGAVLLWAGIVPGGGSSSGNSTAGATIKKADLTVWGIEDDATTFNALVESFRGINPGIKITYVKKTLEKYEEELVRAFAAGRGPDIFSVNHTWLAKYGDLLALSPEGLFPVGEVKGNMVDIVQRDLFSQNFFSAAPLYMDTLALYYNTDLFNSASIVFPPSTWDDFVKDSRLLTKRRQGGDIAVSGSALGGSKNIPYAPDILALLMLQYGFSFDDAASQPGATQNAGANPAEAALDFYTSFAKPSSPNYSWQKDTVENAEDLFAQNRVGMMFGYAGTRASLLRKSPRLQFSVAPMPQPKNAVFNKNYANYWGYGVYKNSKNKQIAWEFLNYLLTPQMQEYYGQIVKKASVLRSVIAKQQHNPDLKVFADQALTAASLNQIDFAALHDAFIGMIESQISKGEPLRQSVQNAFSKIK